MQALKHSPETEPENMGRPMLNLKTFNGSAAGKILPLGDLAVLLEDLRARGKKVVHCHGCFDLLHIGHIRYLNQAREMGDVLVVTVTPDRYVDKGAHRPAFGEELRVEAVASLKCVDFAAINLWPTAEKTIALLQPAVYVKGSDFQGAGSDATGKLQAEQKTAQELGVELAFTRDVVFSSTNLINRFLSSFPEVVREYLEVFRSRSSLEKMTRTVERMSGLSVLVIGDAIIDDYCYCNAMGLSSKDPVLALRLGSNDMFAGGVLAVANHVAGFAKNVTLVSVLGEKDSHEKFLKESLSPNIDARFFYQKGAPTLVKRRFLDGYSLHKLLEVYIMDDSGLDPEADARLGEFLEERISGFDLVLAADFGHGAISPSARNLLVEKAPFLAVNTQANAGNRGFHTISRYGRADFVSIAEHEMRLETRDLAGGLRPMAAHAAKRMDSEMFVVTRGKRGCIVAPRDKEIVEVPAFARKTVDRIGAGDAFFSLTALAACLGASAEEVGFLGNVAGALAVEILGNQKSIDRAGVVKYLTSLLK